MSEGTTQDKIIRDIQDINVVAIVVEATPEMVRLHYNLGTKPVSVETLANMGAALIKGNNDALTFLYEDAEKAGISREDFHAAIKASLTREEDDGNDLKEGSDTDFTIL